MLKVSPIALAGLLLAPVAGAHPGHGLAGDGLALAHHLTEPVHVLGAFAFLALVLTVTGTLRRVRRHAPRRSA